MMIKRPQLTPGTSHQTTRYEVEVRHRESQQWFLNMNDNSLEVCRNRAVVIRANGLNDVFDDVRVVVVSEIRRIAG
jgi:hypothetical protein